MDHLREQLEKYRVAAMLGYETMRSNNEDGRFNETLAVLDSVLYPTAPPEPRKDPA